MGSQNIIKLVEAAAPEHHLRYHFKVSKHAIASIVVKKKKQLYQGILFRSAIPSPDTADRLFVKNPAHRINPLL